MLILPQIVQYVTLIFTESQLMESLSNSIIISVVTTVITLIPVVLLTWAVQKDFVKGMAMGAVKG